MSVRVVLADDHPLFRDGIASLLRARGFEIVGEANNGREALELIRRTHPDLVLMDIHMPERNPRVFGARMFADVAQRFLDDAEQLHFDGGRKGDVQIAAHPSDGPR